MPTYNLWWREAFNSGHTVLFFFLSVLIYQQLIIRRRGLSVLSTCAIVFILSMLVGVFVEALQSFVSREASIS
ncbi:MAG: VanZ family protein, partial [Gammaproteobacteria bacterium]|nr:VanZ family protein [Gammaproteobacteria bacterium]